MTNLDIACKRLRNQSIAPTAFEKPEDVVQWLGAVQAQDYSGALWALGLRMRNATAAAIDQAMAEAKIIRTHPMRGTWHFVAPADIRWLLALTAPGLIASLALWFRRLELDEATFARSSAVYAKTLQGGKQLPRRELAAALEQAGISTKGLRLTFLLHRAELDAVICSGARRGKQFTYALFDEVAPASSTLSHDEALAELARRYFRSHGPATVQDFTWWSGLAAADARAGLALVKSEFVQQVIDEKTYWLSPPAPAASAESPVANLLPPFDEYTVAYKDRSAVLDPAYFQQTGYGIFSPTIVVDGQIVGAWKRTITKDKVAVTLSPFQPLSEAQNQAVAAAAERYSKFVGFSISLGKAAGGQ